MGTLEPHGGRFWDERYGLENVARVLDTGELRPANGFHPPLSYLPQAAVLGGAQSLAEATGRENLAPYRGDRVFGPTGYLLARWSQALLGVWSLWLAFWLGRRLMSDEAALAGAFLVAIVPWHIRQSVIYKPDILLVVTVLLALGWSLSALVRPSPARGARAGLGVGLALASKFNAGPVALPLAVLSLWGAARDRRCWKSWIGMLVVAGVVSVLVFLVLSPWVVLDRELYEQDFGLTLRDYERKGEVAGASHLGVMAHGVTSLLSEPFHGPWVGMVALLGLLGLALTAVRGGRPDDEGADDGDRERRLGRGVLVIFVVGYGVLYGLSTTNPSAHNWLPVVPATALAAAWLSVDGGRRLLARVAGAAPRAGRPLRRVAGLVLVVLVAAGAVHASQYSWRRSVPTTAQVVENRLLARFESTTGVEWRLVVRERSVDRLILKKERRLAAQVVVPADTGTPMDLLLPGADAVVLDDNGPLAGGWAGASAGRVGRFWTEARGPVLALDIHPWRPVGEPISVPLEPTSPGAYGFTLGPAADPAAGGEDVSLLVHLPGRAHQAGPVRLVVGGEELALYPAGHARGALLFLSPRFRPAELVGDEGAEAFGAFFGEPLHGRGQPWMELRRWRLDQEMK